jgi:D-amino-acid dehydrogenase
MQHVIVIGGGVIGLTSAWWLAEAGFDVTLVERDADVGRGASYRNGGQLSYRFVAPLADAGIPLKALRWMFERDSPLHFRPQADMRQWRWLARFLLQCRSSANRKTTARLLQLAELSRQAMLELALPPDTYAWRDAGKLVVYRSRKGFDIACARVDTQAASVLDAAGCVAREPALAAAESALAGGIFTPGEAVADCHAFCLALEGRLAAHPRFHGIVHAQARQFVIERSNIARLDTSAGPLHADAFVLAAGIGSRTLAATAGIDLPLYPLKGYSLSMSIRPEHCPPAISVTDFERKTLYARIGDQLRVAALVDIVGENTRIDARRVAGIMRLARTTMPHAGDYEHATAWAGLRPATPDGAPIIGATAFPNLWLNAGHGALGFTLACGSARLLAALVAGRPAPVPVEGLALR